MRVSGQIASDMHAAARRRRGLGWWSARLMPYNEGVGWERPTLPVPGSIKGGRIDPTSTGANLASTGVRDRGMHAEHH
jgi:hypothetical protein